MDKGQEELIQYIQRAKNLIDYMERHAKETNPNYDKIGHACNKALHILNSCKDYGFFTP